MPSATRISTCDAARIACSCPASTAQSPASPPVPLQLVTSNPETTHLEVVAGLRDEPRLGLPEEVLSLLAEGAVLTRAKLRDALAVKNERLGEALESLEQAGRLRRTSAGWQRLD